MFIFGEVLVEEAVMMLEEEDQEPLVITSNTQDMISQATEVKLYKSQ